MAVTLFKNSSFLLVFWGKPIFSLVVVGAGVGKMADFCPQRGRHRSKPGIIENELRKRRNSAVVKLSNLI
jgi:hypothetical protein